MAEPVPHNESANSHAAFSGSSPATRAPQGTVTPQGTLAVYEPGITLKLAATMRFGG